LAKEYREGFFRKLTKEQAQHSEVKCFNTTENVGFLLQRTQGIQGCMPDGTLIKRQRQEEQQQAEVPGKEAKVTKK
jgi:hypothetical protein